MSMEVCEFSHIPIHRRWHGISISTVHAPKEKGFSGFMVDFLMGGVSAAVSKTVAAPIERVELLIQNQDETIKHCRFCQRPITMKDEGVVTLWRDNIANIIRNFPTHKLGPLKLINHMEHYYQEESVTFINNYERRYGISQGKCNKSEESNLSDGVGGFECNICLDLVQDPVVTLWLFLLIALHFQMDPYPNLPAAEAAATTVPFVHYSLCLIVKLEKTYLLIWVMP